MIWLQRYSKIQARNKPKIMLQEDLAKAMVEDNVVFCRRWFEELSFKLRQSSGYSMLVEYWELRLFLCASADIAYNVNNGIPVAVLLRSSTTKDECRRRLNFNNYAPELSSSVLGTLKNSPSVCGAFANVFSVPSDSLTESSWKTLLIGRQCVRGSTSVVSSPFIFST